MDTYSEALRTWKSNPQSPEAYSNLVKLSLRNQHELPSEIDPHVQFPLLAEHVSEAYQTMDEAGYGHVTVGRFVALRPPYESDAVRDAITAFHEPDNTGLNRDDMGRLPYKCLAVKAIEPADMIELNHCLGGEIEESLERTFQDLSRTKTLIFSRFPDLEIYQIFADYPNDGEVYWDISLLFYLPTFDLSYLLVMQYCW